MEKKSIILRSPSFRRKRQTQIQESHRSGVVYLAPKLGAVDGQIMGTLILCS